MEYVRDHKLHNWIVSAVFKWPEKNKNLSSYQVTLKKLNLFSSAPSVIVSCLGVGFGAVGKLQIIFIILYIEQYFCRDHLLPMMKKKIFNKARQLAEFITPQYSSYSFPRK